MEHKEQRQPGYYWVRFGNDWQVCEWIMKCFYGIGDERDVQADKISEVDENRIVRRPDYIEGGRSPIEFEKEPNAEIKPDCITNSPI